MGRSLTMGRLLPGSQVSSWHSHDEEIVVPGRAWAPSRIPGLVGHWDASSLDLNDGDGVALWRDQSPVARHFTQDTPANRPVFKKNIRNGRPVLRLDSTDGMNATLMEGTNYTWAVVAYPTVSGNVVHNGYSANGYGVYAWTTEWRLHHAAVVWVTGSGADYNLWARIIGRGGGATTMYRDGVLNASATSTPITPTQSIALGAAASGIGGFTGDVAEILLYNRQITTDELALLDAYLRGRYWPTLFLEDNFDRTAGANAIGAPQTGPSPSYLAGSWSTDGTKLNGSSAEGVIAWDIGASSYTYDVTLGASVSAIDCGICFRVVDSNDYLMLHLSGGVTDLYTRIAGTYTRFAILGEPGWTAGDVVRLVVTPTTVAVHRQAGGVGAFTQVGSTQSQSTYGTSGIVGLRSNSGTFSVSHVKAKP